MTTTIHSRSLKLWLPLVVLLTFLALGALLTWREYLYLQTELINASVPFIRQQTWRFVLPILACMVLAMLALIWFWRAWVSRPIQHLVTVAQALTQGNLQVRSQIYGQGELAVLGEALNSLGRHLEQRFEQRESAERALRESEARLRAILDYSPLLISTKDLKGNITLANQHFKTLGGPEPDEFIGKNVYELFPHTIADILWSNDLSAQQGPIQIEETVVHHDGSLHDYLTHKFPLIDSHGELFGTGAISMDITLRKQAEAQAHESERALDSVFEAIPDAFFIFAQDGTILNYRSGSVGDLFGSVSTLLGKSIQAVFPTPIADLYQHNITRISQQQEAVMFEYSLSLPTGQKHFETRLSRLSGTTRLVAIVRDITERKQAQEQIRKLSMAVEQSPVSVTITDTKGNIEYVNKTFEEVTGYTAAELIGQNPRIFKSGNTPNEVYLELWKTIRNGQSWHGILENKKKNGELFWEQTIIAPVLDDAGAISHYLSIMQDVTLRRKQEERIAHQAHFDALTDLPNRFLALDRLRQMVEKGKRNKEIMAVVFVDLDDFKKVNDSLGHDMGDQLLIQSAERLLRVVRSGDTVGRLGGDEFILLLSGLKEADSARPVLEHLLHQFRAPFLIDGREIIMTASVGIAVYPEDGDSASKLLRNADSAMYNAKALGRNTYSFFTATMNQAVSRRQAIDTQIHGALERGEFEVYYQPQINLLSGKVIGAEALLRWHNPSLGEVAPAEFISAAEHSGLIVPIGQFVLQKALHTLAQWPGAVEQQTTMAVNLSARQFRDPGLVEFIEQTLAETGIDPSRLQLEITEKVLMSGHTCIDNALTALNAMGIGLAMDDFGTGYSSLSQLRHYPFNILKIDVSLVNKINRNPVDRELITASIALAHGLELIVIAEGVETAEQLQTLTDLGCDLAQGYFIGLPGTAASLLTFVQGVH